MRSSEWWASHSASHLLGASMLRTKVRLIGLYHNNNTVAASQCGVQDFNHRQYKYAYQSETWCLAFV